MPTLWIFDIEPHEQRYTSEWQTYLPKQLNTYLQNKGTNKWRVEVVETISTSGKLSKGAFLNFAETNVYKSFQVSAFSNEVENGRVQIGDRLLFTDAWHPGVIQCRYLSDLLNLNLSIDVMWHAGSYDPHDILAQRIKNKKWSLTFETALYEAADRNYFATYFHRDMFFKKFKLPIGAKSKVVGWPMEYLPNLLGSRYKTAGKNTIIFPHRMSPEKQYEALNQIRPFLSSYQIVFAQGHSRSKPEYHDLLSESIACFSASKQETLGIGTYEAMLCGAIPIVPSRLSYKEIYGEICYPSIWTSNMKNASNNATALAAHINNLQVAYSPTQIHKMALTIGNQYFDGGKLYDQLFRK